MSFNLLGELSVRREYALADDQQSFLWLGLYYIIFTFNFTLPQETSAEDIIEMYEERRYNRARQVFFGGSRKQNLITGTGALARLAIPNNKPIERWYKGVLKVFKRAERRLLLEAELDSDEDAALKPYYRHPSELDRHDALEQILRDALDSEGWSLTRDTISDNLKPLRYPLGTGTSTTKRRAPDPESAADENDGEKS